MRHRWMRHSSSLSSTLFRSYTATGPTLISSSGARKRSTTSTRLSCARGPFFAKACNGEFKEAKEGVISFPEEEPDTIERMVHYFYHLDYPRSEPTENDNDDPATTRRKGAWRYNYSYKQDDRETPASVLISAPNLLLHVRMYALAAKYLVSGLRDLAATKFQHEIWAHRDSKQFLEAIEVVYATMPDSERTLRKHIIKTFQDDLDLFNEPEVRDFVRRSEGLSLDLIMELWPSVLRRLEDSAGFYDEIGYHWNCSGKDTCPQCSTGYRAELKRKWARLGRRLRPAKYPSIHVRWVWNMD